MEEVTEVVIKPSYLELLLQKTIFSPDWLAGILSSLFIAGITAIVGYLFIRKYYKQIKFAADMKKYGFNSASLKPASDSEIKKMFKEAKVVKFICVSGLNFMNKYESLIKESLDKGIDFRFLCCNPQSDFLGKIEKLEKDKGLRKDGEYIADEIKQVKEKYKDTSLQIRYFSNEYRLPFFMAYYPDKENNENYKVQGFLTVTLAPYKSKSNKSFILKCERDPGSADDNSELNFIDMMESHFDTVWDTYKKQI